MNMANSECIQHIALLTSGGPARTMNTPPLLVIA